MANKGLVFAAVRDGVPFYSLMPLVPGIAKTQFMKAERTPLTMRLARLFNTYYYAGWGQTLSHGTIPFPRVVTVERQIPAGIEVLPYEKASELIQAAKSIGLTNCYCPRRFTSHGGGGEDR